MLQGGVTAYQPTFITSPEDELIAALQEVPQNGSVPRIIGAHLEGPFISGERLGTHPAEARRDPDCQLLERLLAAGPVSHVTLAPELPGAYELIDAPEEARHNGLVWALERDCRRGTRCVLARRQDGDAHLQRDAPVRGA